MMIFFKQMFLSIGKQFQKTNRTGKDIKRDRTRQNNKIRKREKDKNRETGTRKYQNPHF